MTHAPIASVIVTISPDMSLICSFKFCALCVFVSGKGSYAGLYARHVSKSHAGSVTVPLPSMVRVLGLVKVHVGCNVPPGTVFV